MTYQEIINKINRAKAHMAPGHPDMNRELRRKLRISLYLQGNLYDLLVAENIMDSAVEKLKREAAELSMSLTV